MELKNPLEIIEKARRDEEYLASEEYIEAQTSLNWMLDLVLQMGPNCNLECSHCYGNFGPKRKGLPQERVIRKSLEEAVEDEISVVTCTDGEPFRPENREVVKLIAEYSNRISSRFITNGTFARTRKSAVSWLSLLKDSGFEIGSGKNYFQVSAGRMYRVPKGNYLRINSAMQEVFEGFDFESDHFSYSFIMTGRMSDLDYFQDIRKSLEIVFGKGGAKKIFGRFHDPDGRAKRDKIFDESDPKREYSVEDILFYPDNTGSIWIGSKGEVSYGDSWACVRKGKIYGNILEDSLKNIKKKIYLDPVYCAFRLGGVRFLYTLAQKVNPDFKVTGRIPCDVCHSFYNRPKLVQGVREFLKKSRVKKTYADYIRRELDRGIKILPIFED